MEHLLSEKQMDELVRRARDYRHGWGNWLLVQILEHHPEHGCDYEIVGDLPTGMLQFMHPNITRSVQAPEWHGDNAPAILLVYSDFSAEVIPIPPIDTAATEYQEGVRAGIEWVKSHQQIAAKELDRLSYARENQLFEQANAVLSDMIWDTMARQCVDGALSTIDDATERVAHQMFEERYGDKIPEFLAGLEAGLFSDTR